MGDNAGMGSNVNMMGNVTWEGGFISMLVYERENFHNVLLISVAWLVACLPTTVQTSNHALGV